MRRRGGEAQAAAGLCACAGTARACGDELPGGAPQRSPSSRRRRRRRRRRHHRRHCRRHRRRRRRLRSRASQGKNGLLSSVRKSGAPSDGELRACATRGLGSETFWRDWRRRVRAPRGRGSRLSKFGACELGPRSACVDRQRFQKFATQKRVEARAAAGGGCGRPVASRVTTLSKFARLVRA